MRSIFISIICFIFVILLSPTTVHANSVYITNCMVADGGGNHYILVNGDTPLGGISKLLDDFYNSVDFDTSEKLLQEYNKNNPEVIYPNMYLSKDDYQVLLRIVEAEATGGTVENKRNVASVVMNRWNTGWGDTIRDVVFQKGQFSPIDDGRYWEVEITPSTYEAVWLTQMEGTTNNDLYFCTRTCKSYKSGWFHKLKEDTSVNDSMHAYFTGEYKQEE